MGAGGWVQVRGQGELAPDLARWAVSVSQSSVSLLPVVVVAVAVHTARLPPPMTSLLSCQKRKPGAMLHHVILHCAVLYRAPVQDMRTPLAATLASNALNVVLCPLLIFGLGMGVAGAAVATVVAQLLPCWWGQARGLARAYAQMTTALCLTMTDC